MSLNRHEKRLIDILEKNPRINTRRFIQLAGLGKATFYKYTKALQIEGYISYQQIKNEREWYLMRKRKKDEWGMVDFETTKKRLDERYDELELKITNAIKKAKNGNTNEKIAGYGNSVVLILSILGMLKLIAYYKKQRIPVQDVKFEKKLEKLLEKISDEKYFPEYGFGRISIDSVIRDAEEGLNDFLGLPKPEIKYV